jgi:hypothetical protein
VIQPGSTAADLVAGQLSSQLTALATRVTAGNRPGDLDGLFARHVLHDIDTPITWNVDPPPGYPDPVKGGGLRHAPQLAAAGYMLHHTGPHSDDTTRSLLAAGLTDLMRRDPFPVDGVTFAHDPRQLLGIALAVRCLRDTLPQAHGWLSHLIEDPRLRDGAPHLELLRLHVHGVLTDGALLMPDVTGRDITELATMYWMLATGTARPADIPTAFVQLERRILTEALRTDPAGLPVTGAALLLAAVTRIMTASIDATVLRRSHIGTVLRRFPAAMKRWRWDDPADVKQPIQWPVTAEREVQDIVWIMLRSVFDDLVDEEPLRRVGHSSYRCDFGLPRLGVLVEIKYARSAGDFKKIEKEIIQDSVGYLHEGTTYTKLVVFIYDASCSVQEHDVTQSTLLALPDIIDVVIVSRPSHLPAAAVTAAPPGAKSQGRARRNTPRDQRDHGGVSRR